MDQYSAHFYGDRLDVDALVEALPQFAVERVCRKGELQFERGGEIRDKVRKVPFDVSSVDLALPDAPLLEVLNLIEAKLPEIRRAGVDDVEVWAVMHRQDQINGELSPREISKLQAIGASFCWSVYTP